MVEGNAPDQPQKPILALLKVDPEGNVSDDEIDRFLRELGLPKAEH